MHFQYQSCWLLGLHRTMINQMTKNCIYHRSTALVTMARSGFVSLATAIYNTMLYTVFTWKGSNSKPYFNYSRHPIFQFHPHGWVMVFLLLRFGRKLITWPPLFYIADTFTLQWINTNSLFNQTIDSCDKPLKRFLLLQAMVPCFVVYWLVSGVWCIMSIWKLCKCNNA